MIEVVLFKTGSILPIKTIESDNWTRLVHKTPKRARQLYSSTAEHRREISIVRRDLYFGRHTATDYES